MKNKTPTRPTLYHHQFLPGPWSIHADMFDERHRLFTVATGYWQGSNESDDRILACLMALYKLHWIEEEWQDGSELGYVVRENLEFIKSFPWDERPGLSSWYEYFDKYSLEFTSAYRMDQAEFFSSLPYPEASDFKAEHLANMEYLKQTPEALPR